MPRFTTIMAAFCCVSFLAACGGGGKGGSPALTSGDIERIRSDSRVVRAKGIVERADTLIIPGAHYSYAITALGQTVRDRLSVRGDCTGTRCVLSSSGTRTTMTLDDLLTPSGDVELTNVGLGERGGFDTIMATGRSRATATVQGTAITAFFDSKSWGFWGEHGFAAVAIAKGPFSGTAQGVSFRGYLEGPVSYSIGNITGTNPTGFGSATWRGVAEAASTRTFERRQGTAMVTIPDLSVPRPRVGVDIDVPGFDIRSPSWDSMTLTNGSFAAGASGRDRLIGNFHGPEHEEVYGAFDTGAYVGAFGAKRQ